MISRRSLLLAVLVFGALPAVASAQVNLEIVPDAKQLAKAAYAASQAKPQEIAQAKLGAAFEQAQKRRKEFMVGITTADFVRASEQALLEARLDLSNRPEDRLAALSATWAWAWAADEITQRKFAAGAVPLSAAMVTKNDRLHAAAAWLREVTAEAKKTGQPKAGWLAGPATADLAFELRLAVALAALRRQDAKELALAKLEAAQVGLAERWREYVTGKTSSDFLLAAALQVAAAEANLADTPAAVRDVLGFRWDAAYAAEQAAKTKFDSGSIPVTQYVNTLYLLWDSALAWRTLADIGPTQGLALQVKQRPGGTANVLDEEKYAAKAQWAMRQQPPEWLAQAKLAAGRDWMQGRFLEFVAGKTTADFLLEANERLWEAETAVAANQAARFAALQGYWERAWLCEQINRAKFEAGAIAATQYYNVVRQRLHAEWLWAKMREEK